jgi:hypothetical protein
VSGKAHDASTVATGTRNATIDNLPEFRATSGQHGINDELPLTTRHPEGTGLTP